jgi:hypothetical protein
LRFEATDAVPSGFHFQGIHQFSGFVLQRSGVHVHSPAHVILNTQTSHPGDGVVCGVHHSERILPEGTLI